MQVLVVGGGVIGCSIAWHLQRAGASVTVLERGTIGGGASSAAAGMLAPFSEASHPGPFLQLAILGLQAFEDQAAVLMEESGVDFEFRRDGILRIAESEDQRASLLAALPWQRQAGADVDWIDGPALSKLEPCLGPLDYGAIHSISEGHVNPTLLTRALAAAASARGARLLEHCEIRDFDRTGDRVTALRTAAERLPVDHLVLAAGAWMSDCANSFNVRLPVFPVRGQMAACSQPSPALRHTVYSADGYLVPKAGGEVFAGATEEDDSGFDATVTLDGLHWVLGAAKRVVPRLAEARFLRAWAGLRPCAADRLPLLGPLPGMDNVTIAGGHFRNGILLSLITGRLIAEQVLGAAPTLDLTSFAPARIATPL